MTVETDCLSFVSRHSKSQYLNPTHHESHPGSGAPSLVPVLLYHDNQSVVRIADDTQANLLDI